MDMDGLVALAYGLKQDDLFFITEKEFRFIEKFMEPYMIKCESLNNRKFKFMGHEVVICEWSRNPTDYLKINRECLGLPALAFKI